MMHAHTAHLALGALLIPCTMCGTGPLGAGAVNASLVLSQMGFCCACQRRTRTTPTPCTSHAVHC